MVADKATGELKAVEDSLANLPSRELIEQAAQRVTLVLIEATKTTARVVTIRPPGKKSTKKRGKMWFDASCHEARSLVRRLGREVQALPSDGRLSPDSVL